MILIAKTNHRESIFHKYKFNFQFSIIKKKIFLLIYFAIYCVTGGSGFLGQHLVKLLQERDDNCKEIRIVDLVSYTNHLGMLKITLN